MVGGDDAAEDGLGQWQASGQAEAVFFTAMPIEPFDDGRARHVAIAHDRAVLGAQAAPQ